MAETTGSNEQQAQDFMQKWASRYGYQIIPEHIRDMLINIYEELEAAHSEEIRLRVERAIEWAYMEGIRFGVKNSMTNDDAKKEKMEILDGVMNIDLANLQMDKLDSTETPETNDKKESWAKARARAEARETELEEIPDGHE